MKVILCIVSATPELFKESVEHALARVHEPVAVKGFGNGCELSYPGDLKGSSISLVSVPKNIGVPAALHALVGTGSPDDILVYIHDDVNILEEGWDTRVKKTFAAHPKCGLAGFGGAIGLGASAIYTIPYQLQQLSRQGFCSNMTDAEVHGRRATSETKIAFTDGFSMILKRELLDKIGGWSWWPPELVHHGYDLGIACMTRRHGYEAWLVPCLVHHKGSRTAGSVVYGDLAQKHGGDTAIHAAAHRFVYDTFRDVLPLRTS